MAGYNGLQAQSYSWQPKSYMPSTSRHAPAGFEINGTCYFGMGRDSVATIYNDLWAYDPAMDSWTQKADLPGNTRMGPSCFVLDGNGYVCCGWTATSPAVAYNDNWKYDPAGNSWTAAASFPGVGRYTAASFVIDSLAYVGTGLGAAGNYYQTDFYCYHASTDSWSPISNYPIALQSATTFVLNGKGFLVGGYNGNLYDNIYAYDPVLDQWDAKNAFAMPNGGAFSVEVDGNIFIGCGLIQASPLALTDLVFQYNSALDLWTVADTFPALGRSSAAAVSLGNAAYVFGGNHQTATINPIGELWKYSQIPSGLSGPHAQNPEVLYNRQSGILQVVGYKQPVRICIYDIHGRKLTETAHSQLSLKGVADLVVLYSIRDDVGNNLRSGKLLVQ